MVGFLVWASLVGATASATPPSDSSEPLPADEAVRRGVLRGGLRYLVYEHPESDKLAQVRLVVAAGRAQERDRQTGGAHLLEHMMFTGTRSFGHWGPTADYEGLYGSNASTGLQDTTYVLDVQTDNADNLEAALWQLWLWLHHAPKPAALESERRIVIEELKLRDTPWSRVASAHPGQYRASPPAPPTG